MGKSDRVIDTLRRRMEAYQPASIAGNYPEAAVLIVILEGGDQPELLLTKRAGHLKLHPGEAAFPGGKQDPEDESLLMTALREAEEEVDLPRRCFECLGSLDQRVTRTDIKVTPFVGLIPHTIQLAANLDELDCIYTVPLSFFLDPAHLMIGEIEFRGQLRYVPRFDYQQQSIWGVTAFFCGMDNSIQSVISCALR